MDLKLLTAQYLSINLGTSMTPERQSSLQIGVALRPFAAGQYWSSSMLFSPFKAKALLLPTKIHVPRLRPVS